MDMRTYRRLHVRLSKGDREKLDDILSAGVQAVRTVLRALVLCRLDEGRSASKVAAAVRLCQSSSENHPSISVEVPPSLCVVRVSGITGSGAALTSLIRLLLVVRRFWV